MSTRPSLDGFGYWHPSGSSRAPDHDESAVLLSDLRAECGASRSETTTYPGSFRSLGQSRVAEVELQRHSLQPNRLLSVEHDQEQEPEVVAELRIDCVVVQEVPHVVDDSALHPMKDVGRVARDELRTRLAETGGGVADVRQ